MPFGNCKIRVALFFIVMLFPFQKAVEAQSTKDSVAGNLIQFNDNGAWCWFQDERAVVDTVAGRLIIGSVSSSKGSGGQPREGDVEAVLWNLAERFPLRFTLKEGASDPSAFYADDHNAPAFIVRPDGKYTAMYAAHNTEKLSYWRIFDGLNWNQEKTFNWNSQPGGADFNSTYSNMFYLSTEGLVYNISRGAGRSPNFMVSSDYGNTWNYGGRITSSSLSVGYVDGYFRYNSNGKDRIDFICTEHHPRDYNTSVYHGYIKNRQTFKSDGTLMDSAIFDKTAPNPQDYQLVFAANTEAPRGLFNTRCWDIDLQRYNDGSIAAIILTRVNDDPANPSSDPEHAFFYCRFDGVKWSYTYLGKAGKKLYSSEEDYSGLAALCPDNPDKIYISTTIDPRDTLKNLGVHEIFKGTTSDKGASWKWVPVTVNSTRDNLRPIVPQWNNKNEALLWFRGTYYSAQSIDAAVVGIISREQDNNGKMIYEDASQANTTLADGSAFSYTGPDSSAGATDKKWHLRSGYGNNGTVFTSSETGGEDAPALKTSVKINEPGIYDVWVNFWGNPSADWRIKAGISQNSMQLFRSMACKQAEAGAFNKEGLACSAAGGLILYQAYLGRKELTSAGSIDAFVDDSAIQTGTASTLKGDVCRTWYDGVSYMKAVNITNVNEIPSGRYSYMLAQNYPNPFNPSTRIDFSLPESDFVTLRIYDVTGRQISELVNRRMPAGSCGVTWNAASMPSGVYFYRLNIGGKYSAARKMMLLK